MYEVTTRSDRPWCWHRTNFGSLDDAVTFAKSSAESSDPGMAVTIWCNRRNLVIGVVTDDANGITLHKLQGWPESIV